MNIPLNGRIAIIDDVYEQAEPLIKVLSKNQMPYVFYKGMDLGFLPEEGKRYNDIRLLFLDINLIDDSAAPDEKRMKGALITTLKRVLSPDNFPYSIIFWSRHQEEHSKLVNDIFNADLSDRKPIICKPFVKSDFFPDFSTEEVDNTTDLISEIKKIILEQKAYSLLLEWENHIHLSADATLQDLFSSYHKFTNWDNNANYIIKKLAKAFLEKHLSTALPDEISHSSLQTLTVLFIDYLEESIRNKEIKSISDFKFDKNEVEAELKQINSKINLAKINISSHKINEPGSILLYSQKTEINIDKIIDFRKLKQEAKEKLLIDNPDISKKRLDKDSTSNAFRSKKKIFDQIEENSLNTAIVVTPVCDYAQENNVYDRVVKGILIPIELCEHIVKNDAIFMLPFPIIHEEADYYLVLDFRYFITTDLSKEEDIKGLFRVRQELLSEIQSKLARHISRQGILLIDER